MRIEQNKRESVRHLKRKSFSLILSLLFVAGILSLPLNSLATTNVTKEHPVNFNQTISPILSKHCLECHGPDANQRKAHCLVILNKFSYSYDHKFLLTFLVSEYLLFQN